MSGGDRVVEKGADKLDELAAKAAAEGGLKAKIADDLREDAAFLRKLKPSLIKARAKGEAPKDQPPGSGAPTAPMRAQLGPRPKPPGEGGPNPFAIVAGALAAGIVLAKWIDWRGHAHPKR